MRTNPTRVLLSGVLSCALGLSCVRAVDGADPRFGAVYTPTVSGELRAYHPITIDFEGPLLADTQSVPNPFLAYRLDVVFVDPMGRSVRVPGYFAGDGEGGNIGNVWRCRFTPDRAGHWYFTASFRSDTQTQTNIAVNPDPFAGQAIQYDGQFGELRIEPADPDAPGFLGKGFLESVMGSHYLHHSDGTPFVKTGTNSPENFLSYTGFDNTPYAAHDYANHVEDWRDGDPDWDSPDRDGEHDGRGIIGALNYLAGKGINSIYLMPMNIGGDGQDVWPFAGNPDRAGSSSNNNLNYDVGKLRQWSMVIDHAQRLGVHVHMVLNEAESANKRELDTGALGLERLLFYREMRARFGHAPGLTWNISEEYNLGLAYSPSLVDRFAEEFYFNDAYMHPITVHHFGSARTGWDPFLGDRMYQITSLQYANQSDGLGEEVEYFREESRARGWSLPVSIDEAESVSDLTTDEARKRILWDVLLSGGNLEWYNGGSDQSLNDFSAYDELWTQTGIARTFLEDLPFERMEPDDSLVSGVARTFGGVEVLADGDMTIAAYLPSALALGATVRLPDNGTDYAMRWFDPRLGEFVGETRYLNGSVYTGIERPPYDIAEDWVLLVTRDQNLDCNSDGVPDAASIRAEGRLDCDGDGQLDSCQIGSDPSLDRNNNGVMDGCESETEPCAADFNTDGAVDRLDVVDFLSSWGDRESRADTNGDGRFSVGDILDFIRVWISRCP